MLGAMERTQVVCPVLILSSSSYLRKWKNMLHTENEKIALTESKKRINLVFACHWKKKKDVSINLPTLRLQFPHEMQRPHALLKVCGVLWRPSLGAAFFCLFVCCWFFSSSLSSDPPLCPLLIFRGKIHWVSTEYWVQRDIRAIDARSLCEGSSSRLLWCGWRWESQCESCNVSSTGLSEQRETSIFPPQQSRIAPRLSPPAASHDCSCPGMVSGLSGETNVCASMARSCVYEVFEEIFTSIMTFELKSARILWMFRFLWREFSWFSVYLVISRGLIFI